MALTRVRRIVFLLCLAEALSMAGFAAYPTFLTQLQGEWRMNATAAGLVAGAFFFGYMVAVPFLSGVTDRLDARTVFIFSCLLAAVSTLCFAWLATGVRSGAVFQALAGAGLAGTYMPGLKALADRITGQIEERRQARYIAFYTATFGIGTSLSILVSGWLGTLVSWPVAFSLLTIGPLAAAMIAWLGLQAYKSHSAASAPWLPNFPRVLAEPGLRPYIAGYAVHCWELFGLRSCLVAFFVFAYGAAATAMPALTPAQAAAAINLIGLPASILGNEVAGRIGRRRWITGIMAASGLLCWIAGISATWPGWLMLIVLGVYFAVIMADSASLTAGMIAATPLNQRGAAMALYSFLGFGAGFISQLVFGATLDLVHGAPWAWTLAFGTLGCGCLLFALASRRSSM
jgi:MFS family permease